MFEWWGPCCCPQCRPTLDDELAALTEAIDYTPEE